MGVSRPENVDRADQIGVFLETAFDAQKPGLRLAVVRRHMAAGRARPRRVLRRHDDQMPAGPCQLVVQLSAELEPALVEDGFVQTGLGPNVLSRLLGGACRRLGHVPHLQVLDTHHRVVLADRGRGLVQVVAAGVAEWDADIWLINTPGGVVDLRTGRMRPHDRADRMTKIAAATLVPGSSCRPSCWPRPMGSSAGASKGAWPGSAKGCASLNRCWMRRTSTSR